jgi:hypothetical protein
VSEIDELCIIVFFCPSILSSQFLGFSKLVILQSIYNWCFLGNFLHLGDLNSGGVNDRYKGLFSGNIWAEVGTL